MVIITTCEKMGKMLKAVASFYVNQNCISPQPVRCGKLLWKSLWRMWKTIGFQQVFRFFGFSPPCGKVCIPVCIIPVTIRLQACYVTAFPPGFSSETGRNCWSCRKKCCQKPPLTLVCQKLFVKIRQNLSPYQISYPGNTFPDK